MIRPPEYISSIKPYVPGKPIEEVERELGIKDTVKLASNENPLGPSQKALEVIKESGNNVHRYPESGGYYLLGKIAETLSINIDQIILGNGSNEILNMIAYAYLDEQKSAVMATPSFVVYPLATQYVGAKSIQIPLKRHRHDLGKMVKAITSDTRIIFIANPNNPTGTINTEEEFARFMQSVPDGVLVVVDEAYYEYVTDNNYPDSLKYLRQGRDIIILRTFSKIYGLAGLRIGYGISQEEIIAELNKVRAPFNTNSIAQAAALMALEDNDHVQKSIKVNEEGKATLYRGLTDLGIDYVPTEANFIYFHLKSIKAGEVFERLLKRGVIVRPMGDDTIRLTIGLPEENKKFIDAMREVV